MRFVCSVLLIVILLFTACAKKKKISSTTKEGAAKPPPMRVDGYIVKAQPFQENIEVPGTLLANEVAEIHPERRIPDAFGVFSWGAWLSSVAFECRNLFIN